MSKSEKIYRDCVAMVEALPPGGALPSVRQLMSRFGVSQLVVSQALNELKKQNLIVSRIGSGTYKADASGGRGLVALMLPDWQSSFTQKILEQFSRYFMHVGYRFKPYYHQYSATRITEEMLPDGIDALIVHCHWNFDMHSYAALSRIKRPTVLLNTRVPNFEVNAVCADNELGGGLVAAHFYKNGHRKIAMLLAQPQLQSTESRRDGFSKFLHLNGVEPVILDCSTVNGESSSAKAYDKILSCHAAGALDFTAVFCDSDLGALGVMRACLDLGIKVPEQLCIVGFDNIPECDYFHPALSSVDQKISDWAVAAEEIIRENLESSGVKEARQVLIPPELVLRESSQISGSGSEA